MGLSEEQVTKCKQIFSTLDKDGTGQIDRFQVRILLEQMGQLPSEEVLFEMINELDEKNTGKIEFYEFLKVFEDHEYSRKDENEQDLTMGGNSDTSGFIDTEKLILVVRHQFEMTIDIERLIEDLDQDGSHTIDFEEFKRLLSRDS